MKKIIFTLLVAVTSLSAFSQIVTHDTVSYTENATCFPKDGTEHHLLDSVFNNTANPVTIKWSVSNQSLLSGWSLTSICDPYLCYNDPIVGQKSFTLAANSHGVIQVSMKAVSAAADGSNFVTLTTNVGDMTYKFSSCPLSTKDFDNSNFVNIYPNPATNYINIALNDKNISTVNVTNVIGNKIAKFAVDVNRSPIYIPLDNVSTGVYLLQFVDSKGKIIGVKKVTKQ